MCQHQGIITTSHKNEHTMLVYKSVLFLNEDRENWEHCELFTFVNYPIIIWEKADVKLKIAQFLLDDKV